MSKIKSFYEYSILSSRTANGIICDTKEKQLMHYALGLLGEFAGEVNLVIGRDIDKKELSKELGDCFWYMAQLISELEVKLNPDALNDVDEYMADCKPNQLTLQMSHKLALLNFAHLSEYVKKVCCFNHPRDRVKERDLCKNSFVTFILFVRDTGLVPSEIMYENIEKLKARYPDGFSTEKSVNRKN